MQKQDLKWQLNNEKLMNKGITETYPITRFSWYVLERTLPSSPSPHPRKHLVWTALLLFPNADLSSFSLWINLSTDGVSTPTILLKLRICPNSPLPLAQVINGPTPTPPLLRENNLPIAFDADKNGGIVKRITNDKPQEQKSNLLPQKSNSPILLELTTSTCYHQHPNSQNVHANPNNSSFQNQSQISDPWCKKITPQSDKEKGINLNSKP